MWTTLTAKILQYTSVMIVSAGVFSTVALLRKLIGWYAILVLVFIAIPALYATLNSGGRNSVQKLSTFSKESVGWICLMAFLGVILGGIISWQ